MNLHQAIQAGDEELIRSLIKGGVDIHELNEAGETPLHALVMKNYNCWGDKDFNKYSYRLKCKLNEENKGALEERVKEEYQHRAKVAEMLIQAGADVNRKRPAQGPYDPDDGTPRTVLCTILCDAVSRNNEFLVDLLLQNGADVNAIGSRYQTTALYIAVQNFDGDNLNMIKSLLEHGADVNGMNDIVRAWTNKKVSETSLHIAVYNYSITDRGMELIKLLLKYGADVNAKDAGGRIAIEYYLRSYDNERKDVGLEYCDRGLNAEILKLLIPLSDISITPLHQACMFGEYNCVRELCKRSDVKVDAENTLKHTSLTYAVATIHGNTAESQESKVKLLLSLGANMHHGYLYQPYYGDDYSDGDEYNYILITIRDFLTDFHPEETNTATVKRLRNIYSIFLQRAAVAAQLNSDKNKTFPFYSSDSEDEQRDVYDYLNRNRKTRKVLKKEWADYLREIDATKQYMVSDDVSFFDLLVADSKKSAMYVKNENIIDAVEMKLLKRKFPVYHDWLLHTNFGLALERRKLLDMAVIQLRRIFKFADSIISNAFFVKTSSYLSDPDLRLLLGIVEEMNVEHIVGHKFEWDPVCEYPRVLI